LGSARQSIANLTPMPARGHATFGQVPTREGLPYNADVDRDTLRALREGKREGQDAFANWFCDEFIPFFSSYIDRGQVDELIQNTFRAVLARLASPTSRIPVEPDEFRRWVYGFAWKEIGTAARNPRRALARQRKLMFAPLPEHPPGPETNMAKAELAELIERGIPELPIIYREAIEHVLDGGDYKSLAEFDQITESTARQRIYEAKKRLQMIVRAMRVSLISPDP
jgi:RNA polymerase sigma factor (sigma-70 family)